MYEDVIVNVGMNSKNFEKGQKKLESSINNLGKGNKSLSALVPTLGAVAGGFAAVGAAAVVAGQGIKTVVAESGQLETATVKWEVLLGSADEAGSKIKEVFEFSNRTPFTFKGVNKAASTLYSLTDGALRGEQSLQRLGDRASKAGVGIDELSVQYGRLYSNMSSGRAMGEQLARMQELGILSGTARTELENLSKTDMMSGKGWETFIRLTADADGMMNKLSNTIEGKISTIDGKWDGLFALETDDLESTKDTLDGIIDLIDNNKDVIQDFFKVSLEAFNKSVGIAMSGIQKYLDYVKEARNDLDPGAKLGQEVVNLEEKYAKLYDKTNKAALLSIKTDNDYQIKLDKKRIKLLNEELEKLFGKDKGLQISQKIVNGQDYTSVLANYVGQTTLLTRTADIQEEMAGYLESANELQIANSEIDKEIEEQLKEANKKADDQYKLDQENAAKATAAAKAQAIVNMSSNNDLLSKQLLEQKLTNSKLDEININEVDSLKLYGLQLTSIEKLKSDISSNLLENIVRNAYNNNATPEKVNQSINNMLDGFDEVSKVFKESQSLIPFSLFSQANQRVNNTGFRDLGIQSQIGNKNTAINSLNRSGSAGFKRYGLGSYSDLTLSKEYTENVTKYKLATDNIAILKQRDIDLRKNVNNELEAIDAGIKTTTAQYEKLKKSATGKDKTFLIRKQASYLDEAEGRKNALIGGTEGELLNIELNLKQEEQIANRAIAIVNEETSKLDVRSANVELRIQNAVEEWTSTQAQWANTNNIVNSFADPSLAIFSTWKNDSINIFNRLSTSLGAVAGGLGGLVDSGLISATGGVASLIGVLGFDGSLLGAVGGLVDIFSSEDEEEQVYTGGSNTNTNKADIVSSKSNVYQTVSFTLNAGYIGSDVGNSEYFEKEVYPRMADASSGVL